MLRRAVFLDRDGTINEEVGYLSEPGQVSLIPGSADALVRLRDEGFALVVLTNQSCIARGYFTEDDLGRVNDAVAAALANAGASVDAFYFCPHHPKFGEMVQCRCRKPDTGMVESASADMGLDVTMSYFVGDKGTDIELGRNAGGRTVLVLTGFGADERRLMDDKGVRPDKVANDLAEAADWIIEDSRGR